MTQLAYSQSGRVGSVVYAATITPDSNGLYDIINVGALTGNLVLANPTGIPVDGQIMEFRFSASVANRDVTLGNAYQFGSTIGTNPFTISSGGGAMLSIKWVAPFSKWTAILVNGLAI